MRFRPVRFSALPVIATIATVATAPAAARAQSMAIAGAPTPDSLARLVMARFSTGVPDAFDSVYVDPLGRDVVRTAVQQRQLRRPDLERVVVLLLSGTVYPARERPQPLDATAGSDETNRVMTVDLGGPYGFAARFDNAARIASLTLDGRPVEYGFGGGILWFPAKPRRGAQLVLRSTLVESRIRSAVAARDSTRPAGEGNEAPAFGAYHNTDAWLPFFNYDTATASRR